MSFLKRVNYIYSFFTLSHPGHTNNLFFPLDQVIIYKLFVTFQN